MQITYQDNSMTVCGLQHFSLAQILCSGQTFRWRPQGDGFIGVALGQLVYAEQSGDVLALHGVDESAGAGFIRYFDLERDYGAIKTTYEDHAFLSDSMAYAHGMRVLRQPPFETLISFIISANNNVPRIMGIVERLCCRFGLPMDGGHAFPTPDMLAALSEADVAACGAGYRARHIIGAAKMVADGFSLDAVAGMPYLEARQALTELPGVGLKVADCVALYALGFLQAFPADVWMKRVLCEVYGYCGKNDKQLRAFVDAQFGDLAGIAQQYMFHYARHNRDAVCAK
jgi:N-glycosylase/DNA lyase